MGTVLVKPRKLKALAVIRTEPGLQYGSLAITDVNFFPVWDLYLFRKCTLTDSDQARLSAPSSHPPHPAIAHPEETTSLNLVGVIPSVHSVLTPHVCVRNRRVLLFSMF